MSNISQLVPQQESNSARITITAEHTVINGEHFRIVDGYVHKQNKPATVKTKDILSIERQTLRLKRMLVRSLILFGIIPLLFTVSGWIQSAIAIKNTVSHAHYVLFEANPEKLLEEMFGDRIEELSKDIVDAVVAGIAEYALRQVVGDSIVDVAGGLYSTYNDILRDVEQFSNQLVDETINGVWDSVNAAAGFDVIAAYEEAQNKFEVAQNRANSEIAFLSSGIGAVFILMYAGLFFGSCFFMVQYAAKPLYVLRISAMGGDFAVEVKNYSEKQINKLINSYYNKE
jgi:hypothetical protein